MLYNHMATVESKNWLGSGVFFLNFASNRPIDLLNPEKVSGCICFFRIIDTSILALSFLSLLKIATRDAENR